MNNIIRTWKDETYCQSLGTEELAMPSVNSSGEVELTDTELEIVCGARGHSNAPVSDTCLQSILLGSGHCESPR